MVSLWWVEVVNDRVSKFYQKLIANAYLAQPNPLNDAATSSISSHWFRSEDGTRQYQIVVCRETALSKPTFGIVLTVYRGSVSRKAGGNRRSSAMKLMPIATPAPHCSAIHVAVLTPLQILPCKSLELEVNGLSRVRRLNPQRAGSLWSSSCPLECEGDLALIMAYMDYTIAVAICIACICLPIASISNWANTVQVLGGLKSVSIIT